jgi:hypothetical protein
MILKSNGSVLAAAALLGGVIATAGAVHATSIGVQFLDANNGFGNNPVNGSTAGAAGYTQSVWNGISVADHNGNTTSQTKYPWAATGLALNDSSGSASTITLSYSSVGTQATNTYYEYPQTPPVTAQEKLLSGSIIAFGAGGYVQFGNVPTGNYTLVAYLASQFGNGPNGTSGEVAGFSVNGGSAVQAGEQDGEDFTLSSDTFTTSSSPTSSSTVNYLVFQNVAPDGNGNITLNFKDMSGTAAAIDAVQLIEPASTSTPEPATLALFAAGGLALVALKRRRA